MYATAESVIIVLVAFNFDYSLGKAGDVTQTCTCTQSSASGSYCSLRTCFTTTEGIGCFSGRSIVQMRDGSIKPISKVKVGEEVLIFDGVQSAFEPIYDFIHMEQMGIYEFLRLSYIVNSGENFTSSIELSSNHLVFVYGRKDPVFASQIYIGCKIQIIKDGKLFPGEILYIEQIKSQGFYAPLTRSGTIVIDKVVSSNYANARNHRLAHLAMQPYRWWRMFAGPKSFIGSEINWYASILHIFAGKTGLLLLL